MSTNSLKEQKQKQKEKYEHEQNRQPGPYRAQARLHQPSLATPDPGEVGPIRRPSASSPPSAGGPIRRPCQ